MGMSAQRDVGAGLSEKKQVCNQDLRGQKSLKSAPGEGSSLYSLPFTGTLAEVAYSVRVWAAAASTSSDISIPAARTMA